jgi:LuxR family maltose regulon positive regulatory protein
MVQRPRLAGRLEASLAARLTLAIAPAGFGKTTLISAWIHALPIAQAAWLSLDEGDNVPLRFMSHLIAALQTLDASCGKAARVLVNGPSGLSADAAMTALINDLAACPAQTVLVLDDYYVIHNEWVHAAIEFLLAHQPSSLHLVIASREDPPLPLSRLRARGQLVEIRANDLRFTSDEAAAFLHQTMGLSLSPETVTALETRTEGWIAGLQLAALALQERRDAEACVRAFSGSHRYVIDYLVDEVLRQQPPHVRQFLVQTAILDRMCAPLCDALRDGRLEHGTEDPHPPGQLPLGSQTILEYLERANLFLIPLDGERHWYRYHHLFADSLRTELDEGEQVVLHRRAARWFRDNGLLPEAVRHAAAAHDATLAADLLAEAGSEASLWSSGDFGQYLAWVESLPPEAIQGRPRLQLCYGRALYLFGRLAEAEQVLDRVDDELRAEPAADEALIALATAYRAQCRLERGDFQTTQQLAEDAIAHLSPGAGLDYARACYALASAHYSQGHSAAAGTLFEEGSRIAERRGALTLALSSGECAARCLLQQGRLAAAGQRADQIVALGQVGTTAHPLIVGALLTQAAIAYLQNDLERVEPLLWQAIDLVQPMGTLVRAQQCWAYLQLARLREARGDPEGATEAAEQADRVAFEVDNDFYLRASAARRARRGTTPLSGATTVLRERVYMPVSFHALTEFEELVPACRAIIGGAAQDTLPVLDRLLEAAQRDGRGLAAIELQVWRALAFQALGQGDAALEALAQAMALAAPPHCVRPFLDVGPGIGELLRLATAQGAGGGFARALLDAHAAEAQGQAPQAAARPSSAAARPSPLIEPLSERELEVLRLIAEGLSNQEIADQLVIGVGTVKWYATTIYAKLSVGSRTQAAARAKQLGLL